MAWWTWGGLIRVLKPVAAGVALAYMVTGFVDGPPPVNFSPESPNSAKQTEIVEPQAELVIERNVMKLGSLLTFQRDSADQGGNGADSAGNGLGMFYDLGGEAPSVKGVVDGSVEPRQ